MSGDILLPGKEPWLVSSWVFDILWDELSASNNLSPTAREVVGRSGPASSRLLDASGFDSSDLIELRRVTAVLIRRIDEGDVLGLDPPFVAGLRAKLDSLLQRLG